MPTSTAYGDSRLALWLRVRRYAVPPSMIETAAVRRGAGDWAGACAAARVDVDLDLRSVARVHGRELAARVRSDLRRLAPDLLRWHMPRIAPDGLLRPGLTLSLARYGEPGRAGGPGRASAVHLVARTPPASADAGQRIGLALWDPDRPEAGNHPHPRPNRRYRLDLHRHLWDADRAAELGVRSGADGPAPPDHDPLGLVPAGLGCAVGRWAAEAALLFRAEERGPGAFAVRFGGAGRVALQLVPDGGGFALEEAAGHLAGGFRALPVLPDAATRLSPDLQLLRAGLLAPDRLHPLVAAALAPGHPAPGPPDDPDPAHGARLVACRGATHRIGLVDGVLSALDHDPAEIRREELLAALGGSPLPCLRAVDAAHRRPDCLSGVRERLDHGDTAGALAVVEALLGPEAVLREGPLRDTLATAAERHIAYGLYRAGLNDPGRAVPVTPGAAGRRVRRPRRRPRHAASAR
ncbi:hypothetical protein [Streptomyces sp. 1222.5]|uniref:hypothetical protein n=1 Tax=Streptomyces sp. 1222.5 TaxID=1881026 RepID=UPI003D72F0B0